MRRSDREIKDLQDILDVLCRCDVIRLGISTPDYPYIVPMNFGVESEGDSTVLWLHCASVGLKLDNIAKDPRVGFEADCSHRLIANENACEFTMEYESVIGCGNISLCNDITRKRRGLTAIMRHYVPDKVFNIPESALASVCVFRLEVVQITGKRLKTG